MMKEYAKEITEAFCAYNNLVVSSEEINEFIMFNDK